MTSFTLPSLTLATSCPTDADVLVIGLADSTGSAVLVGAPDQLDKRVNKQFGTSLLDLARSLGADTKPGTTVLLPGPAGQRVVVVGPNTPSWKRGRRSVPGRGPRDTYG